MADTSPEESGDSSSPRARAQRRRRRANIAGGRRHKHEVKVTPEEEARLLMLAGEQRVSVPRLLVESALSGGGETPTERRELLAELFAVHRVLSGMANNVNQIAKATNATGEIQADTAASLEALRRSARRLDQVIDRLGEGR